MGVKTIEIVSCQNGSKTEMKQKQNEIKPLFHTNEMLTFFGPYCNTSIDYCGDGDVRLVDGDSSNNGRVEMCLRQRWGSVSDKGWSAEDAQVVCSQLGFSAKGSLIQ